MGPFGENKPTAYWPYKSLLASAAGFCSKEAWFPHLAPGPETHKAGPQVLGPKGGIYTGSNLQLTGCSGPGLCLIIANLLSFFFLNSIGYLSSARGLEERVKHLLVIGNVITKSSWQFPGQGCAGANLELSLAPGQRKMETDIVGRELWAT